jgi:hypothetical protein
MLTIYLPLSEETTIDKRNVITVELPLSTIIGDSSCLDNKEYTLLGMKNTIAKINKIYINKV